MLAAAGSVGSVYRPEALYFRLQHAFPAGTVVAGVKPGQRAFTEFAAYCSRDAELSARLAEVRQPLTQSTIDALEQAAAEQGRELAVSAHDAASLLLGLANGLVLEQIGHSAPVISVAGLAQVLRGLYR